MRDAIAVVVYDGDTVQEVETFDVNDKGSAEEFFTDCLASCHNISETLVKKAKEQNFWKFSDGYQVFIKYP